MLPYAAGGNNGHLMQDVVPRPNITTNNAGNKKRSADEITVEDVTEEEDLLENEEGLQEDESVIELFPVTQIHKNIHNTNINITSPRNDITMNNTGGHKRKAGTTVEDTAEEEDLSEDDSVNQEEETHGGTFVRKNIF